MNSAALRLQEAIAATLTGIGLTVMDAPALPNSTPPYVTFDTGTSGPWETLDRDGEEVTITLSVWSRYRGKSEALGIMGQIRTALHNQTLDVQDFTLVQLRQEFAEVFPDPDGVTQHGVARFKALLQAN